jgi:hypothetical protein
LQNHQTSNNKGKEGEQIKRWQMKKAHTAGKGCSGSKKSAVKDGIS